MVTLCSCLIWQIISSILPSNEYGCIYAWNIATDCLTEDADFDRTIIFSDEAHFDLGIWGTENPQAYIEKLTHPKTSHCLMRILVPRHNWAIFLRKWSRRGLYSQWRSLSGHAEWIFVHKKVEKKDIGKIWFQQDGATCHIAEAELDVLRPSFKDRIIEVAVV